MLYSFECNNNVLDKMYAINDNVYTILYYCRNRTRINILLGL